MSVFKRNKVWWYDFRVNGNRIRESTRATSKAEALLHESLRRSELFKDIVPTRQQIPNPSPRFQDFVIGEFSRWSANEHKDKPKTHQRYMTSLQAAVESLGPQTLNTISAGTIERFKLMRSQQRRQNAKDGRLVTPAAVNRDLAALRVMFGFAQRLGYVEQNPVKGVKFFREGRGSMRVVSEEEQGRYLECASPTLRDLATIMLDTGMRPGEIYHLKKSDLDLSLSCVRVTSGKTAFARRFIPLTTRAFNVLSKRSAATLSDWIFPSPANPNKPFGDIRKAHDAAVARAGIVPGFRLYDLRHTALSRMAMAGIDLPTLKELAGHSQIQMTMRYVHPTPDHKRLAIAKFEMSQTKPATGSGS